MKNERASTQEAVLVMTRLPPQETQVPSMGREDPRRRKWQPTQVSVPGEFHGQMSPWGCRESDTTEVT